MAVPLVGGIDVGIGLGGYANLHLQDTEGGGTVHHD